MCRFASFVLTETEAYWSEKHDSHSGIIAKNNLREDLAGAPQVLKIELLPPDGEWDLARFRYHIDQDIMPRWFEKEREEARSRAALDARIRCTTIKRLKVGGYLDLCGTQITKLPDRLKVGGYLDLRGTQITKLPDGLKVGGEIYR